MNRTQIRGMLRVFAKELSELLAKELTVVGGTAFALYDTEEKVDIRPTTDIDVVGAI